MKKATINRIGVIQQNKTGKIAISGWEFDCRNDVPFYSIADPFDGKDRVCGFTVEELQRIAAYQRN